MKISSDTIGNRTFQLVAQCLNQLRHRVLPYLYGTWENELKISPISHKNRILNFQSSVQLVYAASVQ